MKKQIILAGGCYWCFEAILRKFNGISNIQSGYYELNMKNFGFTDKDKIEVVKFSYDTDIIDFSKVLDIFFFSHTATLVKWDMEDCFYPLCRSAILYMEEEQRTESEQRIKTMTDNLVYPDPIQTKIIKADFQKFIVAADKEQDYYGKYPEDAYCKSIINNKMISLKNKFGIE